MLSPSQKKKRLRRVYAQVPRIACKGLCHDACGPIGMTPIEKYLLDKAAGHEVHTAGLTGLTCSALGPDKRCTAYEDRPLICRLWGVTDGMACEHGCEILDHNGERLNVFEVGHLMEQIEAISPGPPDWTLHPLAIKGLHDLQGHTPERTLEKLMRREDKI